MVITQTANDYKLDAPGVNKKLARKVKAVLMDIRGRAVDGIGGMWYVTEVLRTRERQRFLYSQGRSSSVLRKAGFTTEEIKKYRAVKSRATGDRVTNTLTSMHIAGLACDIVPVINGKLDWDVPEGLWEMLGRAARAHELEWGGDWKSFVDRPHVQLPT